MAQQQNGYAIVPHDTYNNYRSYLLTHGVDVDFSWGNMCWDACALLWYQYGLRLQTGNRYAYGCWTIMGDVNAIPPFIPIFDKRNIKRGDCVVFNRFGSVYTGHIGFADEDYHGDKIMILGQNQGDGIAWGTPSIITEWSDTHILGAFRNTNWDNVTPPVPAPVTDFKKKYPWYLHARKFRRVM